MEITFLGTSSGTPTKSRNVSAVAVKESSGNRWYLVDCGEATQHQILHTKLSMNGLNGIFITHVHGDHCYGLPGLLASAGMSGRTEPLTIVAPAGIKEWIESTQKHTQFYLPYELKFMSTEAQSSIQFGQFETSVTPLSHRVPSFAYSFSDQSISVKLDVEKLKAMGVPQGAMWGQLKAGQDVQLENAIIRSEDVTEVMEHKRKIIVCGDNDNPDLLQKISRDCNVLIHEATYSQDMASKAATVGHSYAKQVAEFAAKNAIPNLLLTHFSPRYQKDTSSELSLDALHREASDVYSGKLFLAEDFQQFNLDKFGNLVLC